MARTCSLCARLDRAEIDAALVAGASSRSIADRFQISRSVVVRHSSHLPVHLAEAHHVQTVAAADDLLTQLSSLRDRALGLLDRAERSGDIRAAVVAIREVRGCLELLGKVAGELRDAPQINVVVSPDWLVLRSRIVAALAPFPDAGMAVAAALAASSP